MLFILSLNFTDQGIRGIKDAPKRAQQARDLAKKVGVELKQVYLTSGDSDLLVMVETSNGDNVAKFALALGALGNVHTRTCRAWTMDEFPEAGRRTAVTRPAIPALFPSSRVEGGKNPTMH